MRKENSFQLQLHHSLIQHLERRGITFTPGRKWRALSINFTSWLMTIRQVALAQLDLCSGLPMQLPTLLRSFQLPRFTSEFLDMVATG